MSFLINLSERIKYARKSARLTQVELANLSGVTVDSIRRYEKGDVSPSAEVIANMCRSLKLSADWLLFGRAMDAQSPQGEINTDAINTASYNFYTEQSEGSEGELILNENWFARKGIKASALKYAVLQGDLMFPLLQNGERFLYDSSDKTLESGKTYIIRLIDARSTIVGNVQILLDGGIRVSFINKNYDPLVITKEEMDSISIMGSIVLSIREWK